ncbi:hypothetical protein FRB97_001483 [Tulasnella sp. 331]|nr:hypothetical protein FRB97_001483 [Tulasnella sp. 331]
MASSGMFGPIVNPYAPQINYNILPLNSRGEPMIHGGDVGTESSSTDTPGWNGAGTSGPVRCSHTGCYFRGNHKDVEVHRMDRHLIYPPGWEEQQKKRKRANEDEDLSDEQIAAKRAGVTTIQGTTLVLDTPEAIQAWIAERKKRYPSAKRVEEKERALQEAKDRGQILPNEGQRKRKPFSEEGNSGRGSGRGRGRGRGRGGGRGSSNRGGRGSNIWSTPVTDDRPTGSGVRPNHTGHPSYTSDRARDGGWENRAMRPPPRRTPNDLPVTPLPAKRESILGPAADDSDEESGSSGSGSDVDPVRDSVSSRLPTQAMDDMDIGDDDELGIDADRGPHVDEDADQEDVVADDPETQNPTQNAMLKDKTSNPLPRPPKRRRPAEPRRPPRGPFNNRPSLLRNLLLPDIRTTVSNLSQAIRFLVANDFLEDVELKPGQAANPLIEVVGETSAPGGT